jgi:hypothetical protein
MPRRTALVLATLLGASSLQASQPQFWRIEGARDFLDGTLEALSVDSEGRVRLAPEATPQGDLSSAQAWCVVGDGDGTLFVGTGSEGKIFRIKDGIASLLFDAPELEVHALALGPDHRLYAGTSPEGKVYAIDGDGKAETFYDPEEKYIWALAFDASERLIVATGLEGKLHRVDRKGKGEVILTSSDAHLTALATDAAGAVFAGSSPSGIVYRIDTAGKVFVLDDTPYREIKALAASREGALYVAAIDGKEKESASPSLAPVALPTVEVTVTETVTAVAPPTLPVPSPSPAAGPFEPARPAGTRGGLLRIAPSGEVETLWSSSEDSPHSLLLDPEGVLLGTGDKGKLYRVKDDRSWSMVATFPAQQVTGLLRAKEGTLLALSNPARVYRIAAGGGTRGSFTTKVKDTETVSTWGRVRWEAETPPGTDVQIQTRSGNTDNPDATWSEWSPFYRDREGDPVTSTRARFIQARAVLTGAGGKTPVLDSISTAYLQRNLRPQVQSITIHAPGEVFQKPISLSGDVEILGLDPAADSPQAQAQATAAKQALAAASSPYSRKLFQKGIQTISWRADDPNGDGLVYDVAYRTVGETRFRTLRSGLGDAVLAWDTSTVPNGRYVVRITARDTPGNPEALALSGAKESDPFDIDNTPPSVRASLAPGSSDRVRAVATDQDSLIRKAEYSVDGGRWREVHPKDGINDAREETYEFTPEGLGSGPHMVVVRATDLLGNLGTARVEIGKDR